MKTQQGGNIRSGAFAVVFAAMLFAAMGATVWTKFSPGGDLTGTWNSQTIANGAISLAGSKITGNLGVTHLNSGTSASSGTFWRGDGTWAAAGGGSPGGSSTQVQYNDSGAFNGDSLFTFNNGTGTVTGQNFSANNQFRILNSAVVDISNNAVRLSAAWNGVTIVCAACGGEIMSFMDSTATGAQTATFVATNKPGSGTAGPIMWIPIRQSNSVVGYIPVFGP